MKLFVDFHHGGLARSIWYLFGDRLGHQLAFPGQSLSTVYAGGGTWNTVHDDWIYQIGGIGEQRWRETATVIEYEEFMSTSWDAFIVSRCESQAVLDKLAHPMDGRIPRIAVSGNENMGFDWTRVRHLISTDESTLTSAPPQVHRILTGQEIGRQYGAKFVPVAPDAMRRVHSYLNNLPGLNRPIPIYQNTINGKCPHCGGVAALPPVNLYELWRATAAALPGYSFLPFGHFNAALGGACIPECNLAEVYAQAAVTWHLKPSEGWGHSVLQSVACGRPAIVGRGFFRYRAAGRYLIPGITAYEVDYTVASCAAMVAELTRDLAATNANARRCYEAVQGLFNWEHEAEKVRCWLGASL